ncbi:Prevent host death protein, Phd antitoxin [Candidatus Burkholderia humilis]|nr:Prevent host death protein, Phd antitoxin [Candidatus Burkholderia humilis]
MATETIDQKILSQLVEAGAVRSAHVVGHGNGWTIAARYGLTERFLSAKRGDVRVFRKLETLVGFLRDMGISRFEVDAADFDPESIERTTRPDRSATLKAAHEAAAFRAQVQQGLDDPRPRIPNEQVKADFAARCAALRKSASPMCSGTTVEAHLDPQAYDDRTAIMDYITEDSPAAALDVDEAIEHQADTL